MKSIIAIAILFTCYGTLVAQNKSELKDKKLVFAVNYTEEGDKENITKYRIYENDLMIIYTYKYYSNYDIEHPDLIDTIRFVNNQLHHVTYRWNSLKYVIYQSNIYNRNLNSINSKIWHYDPSNRLTYIYEIKNDFDKDEKINRSTSDSIANNEVFREITSFNHYADSIVSLTDNGFKTIEFNDSNYFYSYPKKSMKMTLGKDIYTSYINLTKDKLRVLEMSISQGANHTVKTYTYNYTAYVNTDDNGFITNKKVIYDGIDDTPWELKWNVSVLHAELAKVDPILLNYLSLLNNEWIPSFSKQESYFPIHLESLKSKGDIISKVQIIDSVDTHELIFLDLTKSNIYYPHNSKLIKKQNEWKLINRHGTMLYKCSGYIPVVSSSYENYEKIESVKCYVINQGGKFILREALDKENQENPLIVIGDPADFSTWKDSLDKDGNRVYEKITQYYYKLSGGKFGLINSDGKILIEAQQDELLVLQISPEEKFINGGNYSEILKIDGSENVELNYNSVHGFITKNNKGYQLFDKDGKLVLTDYFDSITIKKKEDNYFLYLVKGKTKIMLDQSFVKIP